MVFEASAAEGLERSKGTVSRLEDLIAEAHSSSIEFARKYELESKEDDNDLH
jgi:hypothetical protein